MLNCRKCGIELTAPLTGRPPDYCGTPCRRLAEFEIRRLTRQLDNLEAQREHLRQPGVIKNTLRDLYGRTHAQQAEDVDVSIHTIEQRLRALLETSRDRENS